MKRSANDTNLLRVAIVLAGTMVAVTNLFGQHVYGVRDPESTAQQAQHQEKLRQVLNDRSGYADAIVQRWEDYIRASGT